MKSPIETKNVLCAGDGVLRLFELTVILRFLCLLDGNVQVASRLIRDLLHNVQFWLLHFEGIRKELAAEFPPSVG